MAEDWLASNFPFIISIGTLAAFITALGVMFAYTKNVTTFIGKRVVVNVTNDPKFKESIEGVVIHAIQPVNDKLGSIELKLEVMKESQENICVNIDEIKSKTDNHNKKLEVVEEKLNTHMIESTSLSSRQEIEIKYNREMISDLKESIKQIWNTINFFKR